jgi:NADH:ubiquinone reductase (H+-translocating)
MPHRVVIIGGGFGGLYAARALHKMDVETTLVDRRNYHLFQPLLYQVATGELSPADIAFPLRAILAPQRNIRVLLAEAKDLDVEGRRVILDRGDIGYDTLIVATGARNHYFGSPQWEEFAPGLKSIEEATRIRHRILYAFEAAERETDPELRRAWLTFVVVGAGPTGVELAGALGEIANDTLKGDFRSIRTEEARILLLDGSPRVLTPFVPELSAHAEAALIQLGVRSLLNVRVVGVDGGGVTVQTQNGQERIVSKTVLWAAGVTASEFTKVIADRTGAQMDRGGRIHVDEFCNVPGHPEIFLAGDIANFKGNDGQPLPGVAPTAMQQGRYVAGAVRRRLRGEPVEPFRYFDKGSLAVIGRASAVAQFSKFRFHGLIAWMLWLFIHLMYLVNFQNRLIVFIRWGFNYFTYNRGARLITGEPEAALRTRHVE